MGKELAQQRQQLKVLKSPLRTLYYFAACAASAAVRGVAWGLQHPVFYFLLLPVLSAYVGLKYTGPGTNSALAPKGTSALLDDTLIMHQLRASATCILQSLVYLATAHLHITDLHISTQHSEQVCDHSNRAGHTANAMLRDAT